MATVVGFISEKGGVGKTTACYHIATALNRFEGKRYRRFKAFRLNGLYLQ